MREREWTRTGKRSEGCEKHRFSADGIDDHLTGIRGSHPNAAFVQTDTHALIIWRGLLWIPKAVLFFEPSLNKTSEIYSPFLTCHCLLQLMMLYITQSAFHQLWLQCPCCFRDQKQIQRHREIFFLMWWNTIYMAALGVKKHAESLLTGATVAFISSFTVHTVKLKE